MFELIPLEVWVLILMGLAYLVASIKFDVSFAITVSKAENGELKKKLSNLLMMLARRPSGASSTEKAPKPDTSKPATAWQSPKLAALPQKT